LEAKLGAVQSQSPITGKQNAASQQQSSSFLNKGIRENIIHAIFKQEKEALYSTWQQ